MSQMDKQWNDLGNRIIESGWDENPTLIRAVYADTKEPAPTRYVIDAEFKFDGSEFPIQFGKKINHVKPFEEIHWIMIDKSNRLSDLHDKGIHFWDNWESKDPKYAGTIGKAYGYQTAKNVLPFMIKNLDVSKLDPKALYPYDKDQGIIYLNQIDYLIQSLIHNPMSRRHIITLMNIGDFKDMALPPCVWRSEWFVDGDEKLNVKIGARSSDFCLGNPFNVSQYYYLQRMIAQVVDLDVGFMKFDMGNVHIYDRHLAGAKEIISRGDKVKDKKAQLILPPHVRSLYDFKVEDVKIIGYDPEPAVKFMIAE